MKTLNFGVEQEEIGRRIDLLASKLSGLTRSQVQNLILLGQLLVNSIQVKPNYKVRTGDSITICITQQEPTLLPANIPIEILFQDDSLIVVNKPPDMVVYPAAGHDRGTLMNALAYHTKRLASVGGPLRPGVVHRLDKDTSGVMVIALDDKAYYDLVEQFRERTMNRRYQALVYGNLKDDGGTISLSIGRSAADRKKMSTNSKRGKEAFTVWKVIERFPEAALIEAKLGTGRTHQIRVHFASIGHPVLGDRTYGSKTSLDRGRRKITFPRQMLHAGLLGFVHPITREHLEFISPLPDDMKEKIRELRNPV